MVATSNSDIKGGLEQLKHSAEILFLTAYFCQRPGKIGRLKSK